MPLQRATVVTPIYAIAGELSLDSGINADPRHREVNHGDTIVSRRSRIHLAGDITLLLIGFTGHTIGQAQH